MTLVCVCASCCSGGLVSSVPQTVSACVTSQEIQFVFAHSSLSASKQNDHRIP